jgi:predicted methyltransferase
MVKRSSVISCDPIPAGAARFQGVSSAPMRPLLGLVLLASCAHAPPALDATQIVAAPDRTDRDRERDPQRKPAEMLSFFGVAPGQHVAELGAWGGYSTELFARAVGPTGTVVAQDPPSWDSPRLEEAWKARLARPAMATTTYGMRPWEDPLPPEARNLDAVYAVAIYHDVVAEKSDPAKLNAAVFAALKSGGVYGIIDNSAKPGVGTADCERLHRIDEAAVRADVERAGFKLVGEGSFLRNPADTRDWNADPGAKLPQSHTQDRFALKFVKP